MLLALLLSGCAVDAAGGPLHCDVPEGSRLVPAENGGLQLEGPNGVRRPVSFANGSCVYLPPGLPVQRREIAEHELGFTYDYYRQSLAPCLANLGFPSFAPPSREVFIDSGADWSPYDAVFGAYLSSSEIATIAVVCPPIPPGLP
jgi:hypothetical protein